jgi:uncharacterized protein YdhG (YjbR/CyaY superfamily)
VPEATVTALIAALPPEQRVTLGALRRTVRAAAPRLSEVVKWGSPCFTDDTGRALIGLIPHPQHANLQLFNGADLVTAFPQLEGSGKALRHLKCRYGEPVDARLVGRLVRASLKAGA